MKPLNSVVGTRAVGCLIFYTIVFTVPSTASSWSPVLSLNTPDLAHLHSSQAANHRGRSLAQRSSIREREEKNSPRQNINVYSLILQGRPKKQISFAGARWLLAAVGDAAHTFVFMHTATKHGFGPEGASQRMSKRGREKWVCQRQEQRENKRWWKREKRWMLNSEAWRE